MRALRYKWKIAAALLLVAALVVDFVAKQFAVAAMIGDKHGDRLPYARASDMIAAGGLGIACFGALCWVVSFLRHECGSQLPLIVLLIVYLLIFLLRV